MKKILSAVLAAVTALALFSGCGKSSEKITIAVPNDTTNEARALLLLEENGYIKLKDGAGITATIKDISENPYGIEFKEIEAAQLPNALKDVDYAVINSNYAIQAKLNPVKDSLLIEGSSSEYGNIVAVKEGNENKDSINTTDGSENSVDGTTVPASNEDNTKDHAWNLTIVIIIGICILLIMFGAVIFVRKKRGLR